MSTYREIDKESQSDLKKLLKHPKDYLDAKERRKLVDEPQPEWAILGNLIEFLTLDEDTNFDDVYCILNTVPTDKIKQIVEYIYNEVTGLDVVPSSLLNKYDPSIILVACDDIEYQPKWKPETRIKKVVEEGASYFKTLIESTEKTIISQNLYNRAITCKMTLLSHPYIKEIILHKDSISKYVIEWELDGIEMKSEIDHMVKDDVNKIIYPYDLKSTGKPVYKFKDSFIEYGYDFQDVVYQKALKMAFPDYDIKPVTFLVCETNSTRMPLMFQASPEIRKNAVANVKECIARLKFHTERSQWDYPMEHYVSNGLITIK